MLLQEVSKICQLKAKIQQGKFIEPALNGVIINNLCWLWLVRFRCCAAVLAAGSCTRYVEKLCRHLPVGFLFVVFLYFWCCILVYYVLLLSMCFILRGIRNLLAYMIKIIYLTLFKARFLALFTKSS